MEKPFRFDLQLFSEARKTQQISDIAIQELSLVFAQKDGKEWAPRNPDARVIGLKAGEAEEKKASFLDRFAKTIKGWYVKDGVPDNIDEDGDGAEDYELILGLITGMSYDLQSAMWMNDDDMRSAAIVAGIDSFLARLDDVRSGGKCAKKSGARHSKADKEHIDALADAHQKMGEHLTALGASGYDGGTEDGGDVDDDAADKARATFKSAPVGEDGLPMGGVEIAAKAGASLCFDSYGVFTSRLEKAKKKKKEDDDPYGDVEYADPGYQEDGKKRYPLDTEEHVRAAASYFGMDKNRSKYTDDQQKKIDAKIDAAKKKFKIGDDDGKKAGERDMTEAQVQAMVDAAVAKAAEKAAAEIATAKAEAQAAIDKANAEAETARKAAEEAQKALGTAAANARKATAGSSSGSQDGEPSRLQKAIKAQLASNPESTRF